MGFIVLRTNDGAHLQAPTGSLPMVGGPVVVRITPNHYKSQRDHDVFSVWVPGDCPDWIRNNGPKYSGRMQTRKTWPTAEAAYEVVNELNRLEDWLDSKHT